MPNGDNTDEGRDGFEMTSYRILRSYLQNIREAYQAGCVDAVTDLLDAAQDHIDFSIESLGPEVEDA